MPSSEPFEELSETEKRAYLEVMGRYCDTAKSFTQLSMAALALPILFMRQILGLAKDAKIPVDIYLAATWVGFLVAIVASLLYQYLAVKYLTAHFWEEDWKAANGFVRNPGWTYGVMLTSFLVGTFAFMIKCAMHFFTF